MDSPLAYEGKVVLHSKTTRRLAVRIPSWAVRRDLCAEVSSVLRPPVWVGGYLLLDDLRPGDEAIVTFPVPETVASYTASARASVEQADTCTFRGSTLVDISTRDESPTTYPLTLRESLRRSAAPLKQVVRFVPGKAIVNW